MRQQSPHMVSIADARKSRETVINSLIEMNINALKQQEIKHKEELKNYLYVPIHIGNEEQSFVEGILEEAEKYLRRELYRLDEQRENTRYGSTMGDGWYDWYGMVEDALNEVKKNE